MNLPHITHKQEEIITLIYKHRFLERKHIQQYFGHIDKRRSTKWLKDLKEKQFVDWIYDPNDPNERSTPAIFFIESNGIRYLRSLGSYPEDELRKRYKDSTRQQDFIDRCLLLADCCIHLEVRNKEGGDELHYDYALEVDYLDPDNGFHYLSDDELILPDIAFTKLLGSDEGPVNQTYFLQLFAPSTPRYMIRKKLKAYVDYLQAYRWESFYDGGNPPIALISCPNLAELIYAKQYVRKLFADEYDDDASEEIVLRFTIIDKLKTKGLTAVIWEDL